MGIEATSVHSSAPPIEESLERKKYPHAGLHRLFLVATTGLAIACLVPGARQVSSLALRSVAFFSSSAMCADSWDQVGVVGKILSVARIGVVTLGLAGAALAKPVLYIAALASEVGLQALEVGKALYDHDLERGLKHLGVLAIDTLMLAGIVTGGAPLVEVASWISMLALIAIGSVAFASAEVNRDPWAIVDGCCYAILGFSGMFSFVNVYGEEPLPGNKPSFMEPGTLKHDLYHTLPLGGTVIVDRLQDEKI